MGTDDVSQSGDRTSSSGVGPRDVLLCAGLDSTQLQALHALLSERSVTGAAARLGRTQPTLSKALAQLRRHFGDPLLERSGNSSRLTAFAEQLRPVTADAVAAVGRVFTTQPAFDPAGSTRTFTIVSSDHGVATIGAELLRRTLVAAPKVCLTFLPISPAVVEDEDAFMRTVDGLLLPHGFLDSTHSIDLYVDRWVCIAAVDNTVVGEALSMRHLSELPWIATFSDRVRRAPGWQQMELLGVTPRVVAVADSFLVASELLRGTEALAMVPARVAATAGPGIRVFECPFDAVPLVEAFWWHRVHESDSGHRWLRATFQSIAAEADTAPVPFGLGHRSKQ